jgi:HD superfamily phosphodiesterase
MKIFLVFLTFSFLLIHNCNGQEDDSTLPWDRSSAFALARELAEEYQRGVHFLIESFIGNWRLIEKTLNDTIYDTAEFEILFNQIVEERWNEYYAEQEASANVDASSETRPMTSRHRNKRGKEKPTHFFIS